MQGTQTDTGAIAGSNGRYVVDESVGRGGLGEVFRAHDTQLNRWVAIKRLHPDPAGGQGGKIMQEARHLAALQHPNIVTIYDFIEDKGDVVVVMELLHGRTLQDVAEKAPLLQQDFINFMRQCLEGLIAAHALGMLHRDVKPSNLMIIDLPSGAFQVKILDFGLAKVIPEPSLQTTDQGGGLLGSVFTMSPEQLEGKLLDARSDLYSLGCVGYFALSTYYPFNGASVPEVICAHLQQRMTPLHELRPDLPRPLCDWLTRLMALRPEDRPETASVALEELHAVLRGKPPELPKPALAPAPSRPVAAPPPKKKAPVAAIVVVLLVVAGVVAYLILTQSPAKPEPAPAQVTAAAPAPSATPVSLPAILNIPPQNTAEFLQNVGNEVEVEGVIERSGVSKTGATRFLNFAGSHRGDFTLVFFVKESPGEFTESRLSEYIGKKIKVRGKVTTFDGAPQIQVKSLSQLTTL